MKLTEEELNSYRTAVWNLLVSIEQGWTNYKQKINELKQIDKRLFNNTNTTSAMHSDGEKQDKKNKCNFCGGPVHETTCIY